MTAQAAPATGTASAAPAAAHATARPPRPPVLNLDNLKTSIEAIKAEGGPPPWNRILIKNYRLTATFIYQLPGTKNDHHYPVYDEWWYIAEGELAWEMEGQPEPVYVKAGDFIYAPPNTYHLIHVLGDKPAIRIGFSYTGEGHRHGRQDPPEPPTRGIGNL
jgi:mannose-6-phosphate isomerase-like protein (cupin superfamily)